MNFNKREPDMKMKIVPYGGGWTDVYLSAEEEELYFVISYCMGDRFGDLLKVLYHLYPYQSETDTWEAEGFMKYQYEVSKKGPDGYESSIMVEELGHLPAFSVYSEIPWKADFVWDEEGACSKWHIERKPTGDTEFMVSLDISICREETKTYYYEISYKDLCYVVAKGYTEMLKTYGFTGYHVSVYNEDVLMRHFLFIKAYALDCMEVLKCTTNGEKGDGEHSDFEKEIELLLFDM